MTTGDDMALKRYLFTYIHKGEIHELEVEAYTPLDAMAKVVAMGGALMEGELVEEVRPISTHPTVMSTQN